MTTALIIDDNANNVSILQEMLSFEGVDCVSIRNPTQIETALKEYEPYDVIFLDLEMPNINGYDMLKKLQADSRVDGVPIVAYTVHVSEINVVRDLGFHSFLGKPLDADEFPNQLARILNGERVWANP